VAGTAQHVVAHAAERKAQIEAGHGEVLDQRRGERAVLAFAVGGGRAGLGGERDQRVGRDRLDLGEAAADRARLDGALHGPGERIVAAGVENDQAQPLGGLEQPHHAVERDRLVLDVDVALERGVDGEEIVGAVDLDAVAGIEHDGDVGLVRVLGEVAERAAHLDAGEIVLGGDDLEARLFEHGGDGGCVIDRIGERPDIGVIGIADDQRDALFGQRLAGEQCRNGQRTPEQKTLEHCRCPAKRPQLSRNSGGRILAQSPGGGHLVSGVSRGSGVKGSGYRPFLSDEHGLSLPPPERP
jgi:hypothetical protein